MSNSYRATPQLLGLEITLTGLPHEIDTAAHTIASIGRIAYHSPRHRLTGTADKGRYRVYVRIHIINNPR